MAKASLSQIQELLNSDEIRNRLDELPKFRIAILRNITVESLEPYLRFQGVQAGLNTHAVFGNFDNILQDALGGLDSKNRSVIEPDTDLVLVFYKLEQASRSFAESFVSLKEDEIEREIERLAAYISQTLDALVRTSKAMILWHAFEYPEFSAFGISDARQECPQEEVVNELNRRLKALLKERPNCYYVDANRCLRSLGSDSFYDKRLWHYGRAPYSLDGLESLAEEQFKFVRAGIGKAKKCIVLDCDNTLWGGIIGEDGPSRIKISPNGAGSAYYAFQQELLNLYERGFLLAICSKNNQQDVLDLLENHSEMVLRKEHFVAWRINWNDKVSNIKELAEELNIGLDSMVFVDDSEFETNLVKDMLPDVHVIQVDPKRAEKYCDLLLKEGLFETLQTSPEDLKRSEMYQDEAKRKRAQAKTTDLGEYLTSLEMVLKVKHATEQTIPRVSQLTQKTNQFNLTTKRYTEAEIHELVDSAQSEVLYAELADKWGDSGIVGVVILMVRGDKAVIDTFLLSCRVLGRGVEQGFLNEIIKLAQKQGATILQGAFLKTAKNKQVGDFYDRCGFKLTREADEAREYNLDLSTDTPLEAKHFKAIDSDV